MAWRSRDAYDARMTKRDELVAARDAAKSAWYGFLDECWFGSQEQRETNLKNSDKYRELRAAYEAAQKQVDDWRA